MNGAIECYFKTIRGGLPKLTKVREIGLCAGEISKAMSKIRREDLPKDCPTYPYWDIYKAHRSVTRELFYKKLKSDDFNQSFADDVECSLKKIVEMIGSYHGVLPMSLIHEDLNYDKISCGRVWCLR